MEELRVGIIGCGGRGKGHASGYRQAAGATIVACADPNEENASALAKEHAVAAVYADYREMLARESLDIVSICTWTGLHHEMLMAAVEAGVKAIHAEKPMAPTWGEARSMHQAVTEKDIVTTYCHQRRFEAPFRAARDLAQESAIGDLLRLEGYCPNLFDWGTHWFDMLFFFNQQSPVEWVMGQIDMDGSRTVFGVPVEGSGLSYYRFTNGVSGMLATRKDHGGGCQLRFLGTDGVIEVRPGRDGPPVRLVRNAGWEAVDLGRWQPPHNGTIMATIDIVQALRQGYEPELSSRKALMATELIFATYESSRRRGKVRLPLNIDDSPLLSMIEEGAITGPAG